MSRSHAEQWAIRTDVRRMSPEAIAQCRRYSTTQLADCGGPVGILGPGLAPIGPDAEMCGSAVTLWTKPGDILYSLKAPDLIQEGDVLVIDGAGRLDAAVIGDIFGALVRDRGAVGIVVDGAVRDVEDLRSLGIPTFARGAHPATGSLEGPGALNVGIQCAGVVVQPGDLVRADSSGIVVIPRDHAEQVLALAGDVAAREDGWRASFATGQSIEATLGVDTLIERLSHRKDEQPAP